METVLKAIADWIKGILTAGIMSNLSGLFDDVNTQVGNIAQQVGTKPSSFEPRVFAMIEALSRNVVLPIAGIILTFIACYELIEMITQHNNMAQFEPALIMRWIFKTAVSVWLISNTFDIVMAVFDLTQKVVSDSSGIIAGNTRVNDIGLSMLEASLMQMDVGPLFGLFLQSFFIGITMRILSIIIFVIVYGRMIEIYCMVSLAPIPMATWGNHEQSHMGQNYLKCLFALGFQGFLMQDTSHQLFTESVTDEVLLSMKKMGPYYMAGQKMNNTIIEYINGMEVVKVFNKDADSYERFRKDISDYRNYTLAWYRAAWPWMAIYSSLLPCTIILTLPVGAWFVLCGWSALPNLILVLCLSLSIGMPLLKSLGFLPTMPQLNYKISALEQVLDAPELQQTNDRFHGIDDTITYDHVSFAYQTTQPGPDGKPAVVEDEVLHDISFTAKAGQKTALVGESGSGKSTLAKLLIHYYDPQKGSISIGGQKLCDMSLEALNSRISYVAQDQYLFNTSLLENIRLGRLTATDEEVIEAAKKAQCMEFIEKLPQGIHSMAGDAGKMLSGGQRQRISLARAILKDAPIVVLDEATAYADPENEEKMEAAIAELVKGKTLVVIAHKLPAIMNADQICVIDHGKLVAAGKHQDLIRSCPEYQKLWKAAQDSAEWKVHTAKEGA